MASQPTFGGVVTRRKDAPGAVAAPVSAGGLNISSVGAPVPPAYQTPSVPAAQPPAQAPPQQGFVPGSQIDAVTGQAENPFDPRQPPRSMTGAGKFPQFINGQWTLNGQTASGASSSTGGVTGTAASVAASPPPLTLTTQADPNQAAYLAQVKARLADLQAHATDQLPGTQRAVDASTAQIASGAAGKKAALAENLASRGMGASAGTLGGQLTRGVDEASQREAARATSDINVARARDQEQMDLARQKEIDSVLGQGEGAFNAPADLALKQGAQDISAYTAANAATDQRASLALQQQQQQQQEMARYLALMQSSYA